MTKKRDLVTLFTPSQNDEGGRVPLPLEALYRVFKNKPRERLFAGFVLAGSIYILPILPDAIFMPIMPRIFCAATDAAACLTASGRSSTPGAPTFPATT